jgi:hypothetical protein
VTTTVATLVGGDTHSTAALSGVVTIPPGSSVGDIAVALLTIKIGTPGTVTPPSGWALASGPVGMSSPTLQAWVYTKTLVLADLGADMAFTRTDTNPLNLSLVVYHGEGATPLGVSPTLVSNGTTPAASINLASVTPADANAIVVGLVAARGGSNGPYGFTLPAGYVQQQLSQSNTASAQDVSALIFDSGGAVGSTSPTGALTVTTTGVTTTTSVTALLTISPATSVTSTNFRVNVGGTLQLRTARINVGGVLLPLGTVTLPTTAPPPPPTFTGTFGIDAPIIGTTKTLAQTRQDALALFPRGLGPQTKFFSGTGGWLTAYNNFANSGYGGLASEVSPLLCCQGAHVDSDFNSLMTNMANTLPAGQSWWACFGSEDDTPARDPGKAAYQAAYNAMARLRAAHPNGAQCLIRPIFTAFQQFDTNTSGVHWQDYWTGLDIDAIGFDLYDANWHPSTWTFDTYHPQIVAASNALGVPWSLPETGMELSNDGVDTVAKMAARMQHLIDVASADPQFLGMSYWLQEGRWGSTLTSNPTVLSIYKTAMGY